MTTWQKLRSILTEIAELLETRGAAATASTIKSALDGTQAQLDTFLVSDEIWGGAGSIADQALFDDAASRRLLEIHMVTLGQIQLANQQANARTESWVHAFSSWRRDGRA